MGDPTSQDAKAQLVRQSPLHSAQKIHTPLLAAQGANDPRVKKAESEQIVVALRDRGFPVNYILAPDEGHGFARPINSMALWAASERFFAKHPLLLLLPLALSLANSGTQQCLAADAPESACTLRRA